MTFFPDPTPKPAEQTALDVAARIHLDLVAPDPDEAFSGYSGSIEDFQTLYKEVLVIAREEVAPQISQSNYEDLVRDLWFDYQIEIITGQRDSNWWRYR
jgi:hypothetical protein